MHAHRLPPELFLAGAVAAVGAVDAAVGADHDLLVLFVAITALCLVAIARAARTGTGLRLRPDIDVHERGVAGPLDRLLRLYALDRHW